MTDTHIGRVHLDTDMQAHEAKAMWMQKETAVYESRISP